ncbi:MAG: AraC family transcriptional regulator [Collimonas sp.]|uniref:AraC family transcriptional regulator n=1 Tax=Collimonas sp. TaxID=1963772 RepID=UPI003262CF57
MPEISSQILLNTPTAAVRDVHCRGNCRHKGVLECAGSTHIVFPYRGVYMRHVGSDETVADSNQVLFFNASQEYQVSHPVAGGDACLSIAVDTPMLLELAPPGMLQNQAPAVFKQQRKRIDPRAQVLVALLRHSLRNGIAEPLEAEILMLTLVRRALGLQMADATQASHGLQRLADRAKLVLTSDPARRWTLAEIAAETGGSPVYLTQVFQQVEGMPLYRYQTQLRLARALDLIGQYDDLSALGLDLGFSSHSHFSAAFRQAYGRSPSAFKQAALRR